MRTQIVTLSDSQLGTIAEYHHLPKSAFVQSSVPTGQLAKMTETQIDADQAIPSGLCLRATQYSRITIVASTWRQLNGFCERNAQVVVEGEGRLVVVVRERDGVLCSMHLEGTHSPNTAGDVMVRLVIRLPVSLAEVGRRCSATSVGAGTATSGMTRTAKTRRMTKLYAEE